MEYATINIVETQHIASPNNNFDKNNTKNKFGPQSKNVSSIIRGFESGVATCAKKVELSFAWHSRFYDHIIRDKHSLSGIRKYIRDNPQNWELDYENKEAL